MARKKKKRKIKFKRVFLTLVVILLFGYAGYYVFTMPINNIYVKNNTYISDEEILSYANIDNSSSFILLDSKKIINDIKKNKFIDDVKVNRYFGNKVVIGVKEFSIICLLPDNKVLISNGSILDNVYNITDKPLLSSKIENEEIIKIFSKKFQKIDKNILRQISEITYEPVNVDKERFLLYMDDGNSVYITLTRIDKLNKYNEIVEKMNGKEGIIYLDSGNYIKLNGEEEESSEPDINLEESTSE